MNVLFLTPIFPQNGKGNLIVDLVQAFVDSGNNVNVLVPNERKNKKKTFIESPVEHLTVVHMKSLNTRGVVSLFEKGIAEVFAGIWNEYGIRKYFKGQVFDLLVCATLPITYARPMRFLKKRDNTFSYLLLKDFFPQSAVDLEFIKKCSLTYKYFRHVEKSLYQASDAIGVMSSKSVEYFINHNPEVAKEKVLVLENSIIPDTETDIEVLKNHRNAIRYKYHIPPDAVVFIYGGVISLSQGADFILKSVAKASSINGSFFLFVGKGKGYEKLKIWSITNRCRNVMILDFMEQQEYKKLAASCDVGLVYLDYRFTYPNIPSRTLGHMNIGQPILAATDECTDYKELIEKNKLGLWCSSKDVNQFCNNVGKLVNDTRFRKDCGMNARQYLEKNCDARKTCEAICEEIKKTYGKIPKC